MTKPLLILDQHFRTVDELFDPATFAELNDICQVEGGADGPMNRERLSELVRDASFLVAARPDLTADEVAGATRLKAVIEVSGAFHEGLAYEACFDRGVEVLSCAPGFQFSVAEMGLAMLLAAGRGLVAEHEAFRSGQERWLDDRAATDFTLYNQSIGFVGYGNISRELHRLLLPFSPKTLAHDPWLRQFPQNVESVSLRDLFARCRAVIVTAVPTEENTGLVSADLIGAMQPGAALVLLSRAHVVDFDAAVAAADAGKITFATDVFPGEPVAASDQVRSAAQVVLSPHRAAAVPGGRHAIGRFILHDLRAILNGTSERQLTVADKGRLAGLIGAQNQIERAGRLANT